ncbi:MAG: SURF1 family protein [Pseudomarimonas sp.]
MRLPLHWLLLTLLACGAFSAAGVWQYQRGVAKSAFMADFASALQAEPMPLVAALRTPAMLPRPVTGKLRLLAGAPWLLLDNARRQSQVGIRAVAIYESADQVPVLVDFGWLVLPPDRQLPALDPPPVTLDARGLLVPLPGQGLRLMRNVWPTPMPSQLLLTYLDPEEVAAAIGSPPYAGLLRLDPALPIGFTRDLDALPNTLPADTHFGYAAQWFGFALTIVIIYLIFWFRTRSK